MMKSLKQITIFLLLITLFSFIACQQEKEEEEKATTPKTYTITLDPNGGTIAGKTSYTALIGTNVFIESQAELQLTRTGDYTFLGWAESKNATKPDYTDEGYGVKITAGKTFTLYAVWIEGTVQKYYISSVGKDTKNKKLLSLYSWKYIRKHSNRKYFCKKHPYCWWFK